MTTTPTGQGGLPEAVGDVVTITRRNLKKILRVPDILVFTLVTPIMFVLLFAFVFGGAIGAQDVGVNYREFLVPGVFVQTVIFGATFTGYSLAEDLQKGIVDRFRSLPMSPSAVVTGRTISDVGINVISLGVMAVTGLAIGWRIRTSVVDAVIGLLIIVVFAYAISWIMALVALIVRTPEVVNNASFVVIFPATFLANTFVSTTSMPGPVATFANWNPVSAVAQAARERFGNLGPDAVVPDVWSLQHPELYTLMWAAIIVAIFAPLSIRRYQRTASR
ncbi:ABC transporter permease [Nocardioides sp.]|uniref:ABC transporter permease n=1 Tax=Nocardioides sp. TaxID=35761 RepID=UPI003568D54A